MGRGRVYIEFWWENLRERDHFGRPGLGWEDNIKIDLQEVGCGCKDWIYLVLERDRWRPLVNVKFGMKTNHENTSAISIKYCLQVNKMCDTLRGLVRLIERHCECCGLQRVQLTDEVIEERRIELKRPWSNRGNYPEIFPKLQKKTTRNLSRTA
jgi:hypothetical protein